MNSITKIDYKKVLRDCNIDDWGSIRECAGELPYEGESFQPDDRMLHKNEVEKLIDYLMGNIKNVQIKEDSGEFVISDVFRCARCTKDHLQLKFKKFKNDYMYVGVKKFEYWGICPETSEPILLHLQYSVE